MNHLLKYYILNVQYNFYEKLDIDNLLIQCTYILHFNKIIKINYHYHKIMIKTRNTYNIGDNVFRVFL